jgi:hypothetical protein
MLGVAGLPAILQAVLFIFLPESPRWLVRQKRFSEAAAVLQRIYPTGTGKAEFDEVAAAESEWHEEGNSAKETGFWDILATRERRMALRAGVGIQVRTCPFFHIRHFNLAVKLLVFFHVYRKDSKVMDFTTCAGLPAAGWYKHSDVL